MMSEAIAASIGVRQESFGIDVIAFVPTPK